MKTVVSLGIWTAVIAAGIWAYVTLATHRHEPVNSSTLLIAAVCSYAIGYRFYAKWVAARVLALDDRRATPCEVHEDGRDFVKTNRFIVFGHHFAAISGPGPLVGPVLAAQFGYLPGSLWILIGVVLGGAVQDMVILFASMRRDGKSLAQMVKEELNPFAGALGLVAILSIMVILLAVLALVVVNVLAESPWGVFTVGATVPIALLMGGYLRYLRVGKILEVSALGVVLLLLAVWGGQFIHANPEWSRLFRWRAEPLAWAVIAYGFAASVLPVWLLLAPRDYLSTFMKLGTISALAVGTLLVLPDLRMPALSKFVDGSGLVVPGGVFPFCFITIACGAISGFHTLISSGITPKIITRERYVKPVGYGAMLLESLVAIMAMIAACTMDPGIYLAMNVKGAGATPAAAESQAIERIEKSGFTVLQEDPAGRGTFTVQPVRVSAEEMHRLAGQMGEATLFGRTGGAATLAVGMAMIFSRLTDGRWLDLWYHFAVMFEALFILTTLDAGTRVGRYLIQDAIRPWSARLGDTRSLASNVLASVLIVSGWGWFLIQGVRDPEGGIKALWPIFGIANQLLASIALCLATTILLKLQLRPATGNAQVRSARLPPAMALVTLIPLAGLLAVTLTAGVQKVFHANPRIGFLSGARAAAEQGVNLERGVAEARARGDGTALATAEGLLKANRMTRWNHRVDAAVTGFFLVLVVAIVAVSVREWVLLLARRRVARLSETEPVWLPDHLLMEARPSHGLGLFALSLALVRDLTGEAAFDRARSEIVESAATSPDACQKGGAPGAPERRQATWLKTLDARYRNIRGCC